MNTESTISSQFINAAKLISINNNIYYIYKTVRKIIELKPKTEHGKINK